MDVTQIEGSIPEELEGTYFRNGPGLQVNHAAYERHPFDGDGCLISLAIKNGKAFFRNKYIQTPKFVEEQAAGKLLYRSAFCKGAADGSPFFNPLDLDFKSVANTGVLHWAGRVMALWEGGLPFDLDPSTLATKGETDLDGQIGRRLSGHYRITTDPETGVKSLITFAAETSHTLFVPITFVHDMVVTDSYYILVLGPLEFDMKRFVTEYIWGQSSIAQCLKYTGKGNTKCLNYTGKGSTKILLYPRPGRPGSEQRKPQRFETEPFFPFHHVNAFDVDSDATKLVIDTIGWDKVDFNISAFDMSLDMYVGSKRPEYRRLVVDLESGCVQHKKLTTKTMEFPTMNSAYTARRHRYSYFIGVKDCLVSPAQLLMKVDADPEIGLTTPLSEVGPDAAKVDQFTLERRQVGPDAAKVDQYTLERRQFPGEPMFVPRKNGTAEDDGWIADIMIFNAQRIADGPLATIHLPHTIPSSFHGHFTGTYLGPDPEDKSIPTWAPPTYVNQI
eukprot:gene6099-2697_t